MRIGFDVSQTGPHKAGCGFYAASLIEGLLSSRSDNQFTLLTSFGDFYHDPSMAINFPHLGKGVSYGPRHLQRNEAEAFWQNRVQASQLLNNFNVVHANNFWCPPWPLNKPLIYTLYDMSFCEHPEWTTETNRIGCFTGVLNAALRADWFVAISAASKQSFLRHFPHVNPDRVRVIYPASRFGQPGFNQHPNQPKSQIFNEGLPYFLSVGTIEPRKNQAFLLDVYNSYRDKGGAAIPLVLAGGKGWMMEDFDRLIDSSSWNNDIHLLGYVSDAELNWLYRNCLVNLYPSLYEGFGLPVLEGMGFGAAVISSSSTSIPEIVGEAGISLDPNDLEGWVGALQLLSTDKSARKQLSEAAKLRAQAFNWQQSSAQLISLYEEALAEA
jgi:glycosyltransferase involved in cell wall biosynthesis